MTLEREYLLDTIMLEMPKEWRARWCTAQICGCMGCANVSGKLWRADFTKEDWETWIKKHPDLV